MNPDVVGLFVFGGNVNNLTDPQTVLYLPIINTARQEKWLPGPEPEILRGTIGSSAIVINSNIFVIGGYEPRTERYLRTVY